MATFTVTHKQLIDNYAVLQLLTSSEIVVGQSITISGMGAPLDAAFIVVAMPAYKYIGINGTGDILVDGNTPIANQIMFALTAANITRIAATGTVTYGPVCTWITDADAEAWLGGIVAGAADIAFITTCVAAANEFAYRRRENSGYFDKSLTVAPSSNVKLAVQMFAGALYRQRGSIDSFASFSEDANPIIGFSPIIKQLLGVDRPAVATR